jgi:hypothetical protein
VKALPIVAIVEGHGEVEAVPILLRRIAAEVFAGTCQFFVRRPPIRYSKGRIASNKGGALERLIELAAKQLSSPTGLILVLVDADEDLPCELGPRMLQVARTVRSDLRISCVVANVEYETWLAAGAEGLLEFLNLDPADIPDNPEKQRVGKSWIERRLKSGRYSETVDQPKLTAHFDIAACRQRSPSFDKLCRDLESAAQSISN